MNAKSSLLEERDGAGEAPYGRKPLPERGLGGCSGYPPYLCPMPFFTDQLNRTITILSPPARIVSLVPSQTELLHSLGLEQEVVGITKFCVHPKEWHQTKERIGGTKNVNLQKVRSLQPNLVIANKEENTREQIEELAEEFPVWVSDVNTLGEALEMIRQIGAIVHRKAAAETLASAIQTAFDKLVIPAKKLRIAYLIWKDPYMTVGGDTFIHHLLQKAGFQNVFSSLQRYPVITVEELQDVNCDLLFLSSEPYPFQQNHLAELQDLLPAIRILLVDGELFSWYGSRLLQAPAYFQKLQAQSGLVL